MSLNFFYHYLPAGIIKTSLKEFLNVQKIKQMNIIFRFIALGILLSVLNINSFCQNKTTRIAIAQIVCIDSDRSGNFIRIENAIKEAVSGGAEIICFPETSILGWVNPAAHELSFPIPGKDTERLSTLARMFNIFICIGLAEKEENKLYDTVVLIDNNGQIIMKHRKINILEELMSPPYTKGRDVNTINTKFGKIGMLICADTFKEDILKKMKDLQPDIMFVPYGWAAHEDSWPDHGKELLNVVRNTAKTIKCPVIGTDLVGRISNGPWTGLTYGGQSVAVDKKGNILATGKDRDREIIIIEINIGKR